MRVVRRRFLIAAALLLSLAVVACASRAGEEPAGGPRAAGAGAAAGATTTSLTEAEVAEVRELGLHYWEVFNSYDLEGVLALLEPAYAKARRSQLESDIGQVERFNVTLSVSVLEEPRWTGADTAEMALRMRTPIDVRRILMRFVRSGGSWLITFAEEMPGS